MSDGGSVRHADVEDVRGPLWEEAVAAGAARGPLVPAEDHRAEDADQDADQDAGGDLTRYLRWQARDWVRTRGVWIFAAVLAVLVVAWLSYDPAEEVRRYQQQLADLATFMRRSPDVKRWVVRTPAEILARNYLAWASLLSVFGSVAATFGVVARERERGLQRFLFAKPVRATRYYLQKMLVAAAGYLAIMVVGSLLASLLFGTALPIGAGLAIAAGVFAALGALTFLLSTLTRFDGGGTLAALFAGYVAFIVANARTGVAPGWVSLARAAEWVLPPVPTVAAFSPANPGDERMSAVVAVLWLLAYAAAAVAAGLAVLRRRSITT